MIVFKIVAFDQDGVILRVQLKQDTGAAAPGEAITGLAYNSAGLAIAVIGSTEASATVYTQAAGNIEDIATLGTYVAPSSGKCRFKQVDGTYLKGLYEIQLANDKYAISNAQDLAIGISGAADLNADCGMVEMGLMSDTDINTAILNYVFKVLYDQGVFFASTYVASVTSQTVFTLGMSSNNSLNDCLNGLTPLFYKPADNWTRIYAPPVLDYVGSTTKEVTLSSAPSGYTIEVNDWVIFYDKQAGKLVDIETDTNELQAAHTAGTLEATVSKVKSASHGVKSITGAGTSAVPWGPA